MTEEIEPKRKRERSPSYPAIPLGAAVEKAKDLYAVEKGYLAPINTILKDWGYSPKSGAGLVVVAALLKFGLLDDEGSGPSRKAKITELGQRIVRDTREGSPDRARLLREAALRPRIHRDLWEMFGANLPSDSNLRHTLIFDYKFTDSGASEFIRQFKATILYAGLGEEIEEDDVPFDPADLPRDVEHIAPQAGVRESSANYANANVRAFLRSDRGRGIETARVMQYPAPAGTVLPLPIAGTAPERWPSLHLPVQLSEADWQQMKLVLEAMKPGIVRLATGTGHGLADGASVETEAQDAPNEDE